MRYYQLISIYFLLFVLSVNADQLSITVCNKDIALVKESRQINLPNGKSLLEISDIATQIDPTSVHLNSADSTLLLLEQDYRFDLLSSAKLLHRFLGDTVSVSLNNGELVKGKLLSSSQDYIILQTTNASIRMIKAERIESVISASIPDDLFVKPTLQWHLQNGQAGEKEIMFSYLTSGIKWHAEYIAQVDQDDEYITLAGWATIENKSGKTYKDANLKLVAGDIHVLPKPRKRGFNAEFGLGSNQRSLIKAQAGIVGQRFYEYYLYDYPYPTTILNNETKQIALLESKKVKMESKYIYNAKPGKWTVEVNASFKNSEENGLGVALPKGVVRLTKNDSDGEEQFIGESRINHTPKDETVTLQVGSAFDIVGETIRVDSKRVGKRDLEEKIQFKVRNYKDKNVTVLVRYHVNGRLEVKKSSHEFQITNQRSIEFNLPILANSESIIDLFYRVKR